MDPLDGQLAELARLLTSAIQRACAPKTGVVFSSGIDSALVAFIAAKNCDLSAYLVGTSDSEDMQHSVLVEKDLPFRLKRTVIDESIVEAVLPELVSICGTTDPLKVSVGVPMYFAAKAAKEDGLSVVLSGQGGDELFGGYNRYLDHAAKGDYPGLQKALQGDADNAYIDNLDRDTAIFSAFGIDLRFPYMDEAFSSYAMAIPAQMKVFEVIDDAPKFDCVDKLGEKRFIRKYMMRLLAREMGLPKSVLDRKKKAAQYGSESEKVIQRLARKAGYDKKAVKSYLETLK